MVLLIFGTGLVSVVKSGFKLVLLGIRNWFVGTGYQFLLEEPVPNSGPALMLMLTDLLSGHVHRCSNLLFIIPIIVLFDKSFTMLLTNC